MRAICSVVKNAILRVDGEVISSIGKGMLVFCGFSQQDTEAGIEKALKNNGVEVLLISPGNIELKGFDYGFIGGAGFYNNGTVYFFGNVKKHPDYDKIKQFCDSYNSDIEILCQDMPLTDIGSAVVLSNNN
jgi:hypothetical protein